MGEGLQAAAPHGRQLDHAHASVEPGQGSGGVGIAGVDQDAVAPVGQAAADLLDRGLEAAVACGNAAGPDHRDSQALGGGDGHGGPSVGRERDGAERLSRR